jgi:hypothetical protein
VLTGTEDDADEAARHSRHVASLLGGDACHNVDRIMRLPGSINRPNVKKRKHGRGDALSFVVEQHDDRVYDLSDFPSPLLAPPAPRVVAPFSIAEVPSIASIDDLPGRRIRLSCG